MDVEKQLWQDPELGQESVVNVKMEKVQVWLVAVHVKDTAQQTMPMEDSKVVLNPTNSWNRAESCSSYQIK